MENFFQSHVSNKENTLLAEQIRVISKDKLLKYLGKMNKSFMRNHVDPLLQASLELTPNSHDTIKLSTAQAELFKSLDTIKLVNITKSNKSNIEKISEILIFLGFNATRNGFNFLCESIFISIDNSKNLKDLSEMISTKTEVSASEIERLIVARVKEKFNKKISTIQFIRLISTLIDMKGALQWRLLSHLNQTIWYVLQ